MPYRKKYKNKKKNWDKKDTIVRINRPVIPDTTIVTLRYHQTVFVNPSTGLAGSYLFRANSIQDPNYTDSTGDHQPYGHDEWSNFYQHYCVMNSKCTARFISQSSVVANGSALAVLGLQRSATLQSDVDTIIERRDASTKFMSTAGSNQACTLVKKYDAKKFHGYTDLGDSAETRTAIGSNPLDVAYFNVSLVPLSSAYDVDPTAVSVTIDYTIKFMERQELLQS